MWRKKHVEHKQFREAQLLTSESARYVRAASPLCCMQEAGGEPAHSTDARGAAGQLCARFVHAPAPLCRGETADAGLTAA